MKIRSLILALTIGFTLTNCTEDVEKLAKPYLDRAQLSFNNCQYALAKQQIDSIKQLYPKALDIRTKAQVLLIETELAEACSGKHYTDSLLAIAQAQARSLAQALYLDKDSRYQDTGIYYASSHRTEKNVGKSYLRPQTNEKDGTFTITAFYRGKPIDAHTLRFTAPDGSHVELSHTAAPYVMSDATGHIERTDFAATPDVTHFVAKHASIKASITGKNGKTQIPFTQADIQAFSQVAELATVLQASTTLQVQQQELDRRIKFYKERQARTKPNHQ